MAPKRAMQQMGLQVSAMLPTRAWFEVLLAVIAARAGH